MRHTLLEDLFRLFVGALDSLDLDRSGCHRKESRDALDQFGLTIAVYTGHAQNFPRLDLKRDVAQCFQLAFIERTDAFHLKNGASRRRI